ncbi:MAG: amino acid adenylation domain-containing protein [Candidatus Aminicenantes bacterium]|nr:MAG: amino acid adenylation domain-containing protein [Candidatus Aminicenantes bacterium]
MRLLENGEMEYLGRIDHQVKIRGFRIEPGEIEKELLAHEGIKQAAVIDWQKQNQNDNQRYLCAYFVPRQDPGKTLNAETLREYLLGRLPDYMIPAYFMPMEKIPLTPNGKLDRKGLPEPRSAAGIDYEAPEGEVGKGLAEIWQQVLAVERIGANDNFFALGGDSMKAIKLIGSINNRLGTNLGVVDIYSHQTIGEMTRHLNKQSLVIQHELFEAALQEVEQFRERMMKHPQILETKGVEDVYPMSDIEKGMVFHYLRGAREGVYHDQIVVQRNYRHFDLERMKQAVSLLVEKHPILRTGFFTEESAHVIYRYDERFANDVSYHDISSMKKAAQEVYIKKYLSESRKRGYDIFKAPLWRIRVFKCGSSLVILIWESHHAIIDGWSNASFLTELNNTYLELERDPGFKPGKLKVGYKQFITYQLAAKRNPAVIDYWKNRLTGYKRLKFPPQPGTGEYKFFTFDLGARVREQLEEMAKKQHTSLKHLCLSAFIYVLSMFSYEPDITTGLVTHNRPETEDGDKILGCFLNTVPFRVKIPAGITWADYIGIVENQMVHLKKYEKLSLMEIAKLVGESPEHSNPFFDIVFNLVDFHVYSELVDQGDAAAQDYRLDLQSFARTNFLLEISIVTYGSQLTFTIHFSTAFISQGDAKKLYTFFNEVLEKFIYHPHGILDKDEIIPEKEKRQLLHDLNNTARDYAGNQTIPGLFAEQAEQTPDNIAVVGPSQTKNRIYMTYTTHISYSELNQKSDQLAHVLRQKGVQPDTVAAIMVERSVEMIIGTIAILKAGGAYLPIDPDYPEERINYMLKDSGTKILLSEGLHPDFPTSQLPSFPASLPSSLAYVIYTSGSTGKPKGVLVEHGNAVNILLCRKEIYKMNPAVTTLLLFSYSFDGFVTDFFTPVISGARVILTGQEERKDPGVIKSLITGNHVTHIFCTPPLYQAIIEGLSKTEAVWLKVVTLGGDRLPLTLLDATRQKNPGIEVVHEYGVTEAAVTSTLYQHQEKDNQIKIGAPIWNTMIYILDSQQQLQPIGTAGEMGIGGAGVARGYLNRPELTCEKFDHDLKDYQDYHDNYHRSYRSYTSYISKKIYKTGDLARWLPDKNIEFLGRIDFQVKIRGFRIEPGEIENRLLNKTGIKNAVVAAREDERGNKYLCAYIVSASNIQDLELKEYLSKQVPDYMIPSCFVFLDKIPLTSTGKVDSKALPQPGLTAGPDYAAPRDEVEKRLVEVWQDVLGIERVGIMDNFFQMGGDSIKAMQVVSRLKTRGLNLKINDLFSQPTIKQLAGCVTPVTGQIPQEVVKGEVPLTPIQRWFFAKNFTDGHHFNQAVMLYRPGGIDQDILKQVFTKLTEHHDALRMVYELDQETGDVIQRNRGIEGQSFDLAVFDFENDDDTYIKQSIEKEANVIQAGVDLTRGPLVKLGLFKTVRGDHLLIVIHHLVIDGVSWRILLEDLNTAFNQVQKGEPIRFPDKTDSFQRWSRNLTEYARKQALIKSFCGGGAGSPGLLRGGQFFQKAPPLDRKINKDKRKQKYTEAVTLNLSETDTRTLLKRVNQAYNTEINDILLTALGKTVKEWAGIDEVMINLEGHGRESIIPDLDISRTVGWFTAQYPVILDMSQCDDLSYAIKRVKETLRRIPHKGIGYGIWRYLTLREEREGDFFEEEPEISFNYLGQFDSLAGSPYKPAKGDEKSLFQFSSLSKGRSFSPELDQFHTLIVTGMVVEGKLSLSFTYNRHEYDKSTIRSLAKGFERNLLDIIRHCTRKQERELTPSDVMDVSYSTLSLEEFTVILDYIKNNIPGNPSIEAMYPLGPMQKGILYHWLTRTHYDMYFIQTLFQLEGGLDKSLLEAGLNNLIQRYDIFRTIFIYQGVEEPLQAVLNHRRVKVHYKDILHLPGKEQAHYVEEWCQREKERGFDLGRDVMMRLSLFKTGENQYQLVWGFHHILMDGWCLGIIYNELAEIYKSLAAGKAFPLKEVTPYRSYIKWWLKQDKEAAVDYWEKYLSGYRQQAGLPKSKAGGAGEGVYKLEECQFAVDEQEALALVDFSSKNRITVSTVFQGLWGLLLQKYNNSSDVVFGAVVSGRPPELPGIEQMVGLFINTIPVRVISHEGQTFSQLVMILQQDSTTGRRYEYLPLADIQAQSELRGNLIDHILVFENYPVHQQVKQTPGRQVGGEPGALLNWRVQDITVFEQTNYDFYITILPGEVIRVKLSYNSLIYDRAFINRVGIHMREILRQVAVNPGIQLKKLGILTAEEKQQILFSFNGKGVSFPVDKPVHQLFREQVERTPDRIALVGQVSNAFGKNIFITYRELNERSDQLARILCDKGVECDAIVGIMVARSVEMIFGILGILKSGGAYLPIAPEYPEEGIKYMLADSKAKVLLTDPGLKEKFEELSIVNCQLSMNEATTTTAVFFNPQPTACNSQLAYVIYTSGSTGKPKGTLIRHVSVVNRLVWMQKQYPLTGEDVILQKTPFTFDVSVWELFWWGIAGAGLCLLVPGGEKDPGLIVEAIELCRVSVMHFVPSMLGAFMDYIEAAGAARRLCGLRQVFASGEALSVSQVNRFNKLLYRTNRTRLANLYGPTEATVDVSYFDCSAGENLDKVPIGKPIDNIGLFVLDRWGRLQPIGMAGELCITGVGLAPGYLNQPELTAAKFDHDLWDYQDYHDGYHKSYGSYRSYISYLSYYKTGDLACWLPDGNIEFLGRIDFQVKIRGFRIEPGEIESRLLKKPRIKNAVVLARKDETGDNYLCAYIVSEGEIPSLELQDYLSAELPAYMIPAYFIFLDKIPLTANGKVDRKSLPVPGKVVGRDYEPPGDEVAKRLVEIWQEVLGVERIGITDNFFAMGGDSIKAIQVTSRLRKYGLDLKINDIFAKPVIKQLAGSVNAVTRQIPQGAVQGEVPLTPIQHWFFQSYITHRHHFNQAIMLYRAEGFDENILKKVFTKLTEHHDVLRMVFEFSCEKGEEVIIQKNRGLQGKLFDLEVFDFKNVNKRSIQREIEERATKIQGSIDLEKGPLVKLGLFGTAEGDHLLIVIHHLVIDGVSWRILLEDFKTAYRQAENEEPIKFPQKTDSFKHWSEKITEYASKPSFIESFCGERRVQGPLGEGSLKRLRALHQTLCTLRSAQCSRPLVAEGKKISKAKKKQKHTEFVTLELSQADTQSLLKRVNRAYNTEINDILLTALGIAIKEWGGIDSIFIHLEGHGRESIIEDVDIGRTVGWFTSLYPVMLDMSQCDELSHAIKSVKETLRRIPHKGIGYGILKYLTPGEERGVIEHEPELLFNYLGQFDSPGASGQGGAGSIVFSWLGTGSGTSPEADQVHRLSINSMIVGGKLSMSFAYNRHEYDKSTIRSLADGFKRNLLEIIRHCSGKQERELTPSDVMDVSYLALSLEEFTGILDNIKSNIPGNPAIEAVYPLAPMQKGMFYHWLSRTHYDIYFIQTVFQVEGTLDKSLLEGSFNKLIERYDIFRVIFAYQGLAEPCQVVLSHRQQEVHYEDIVAAPANYLEEWLQKEKERGVDLGKDVLMRLSLFKTGGNRYRLVWGFHHILMDGWCLGIIYNELVEIYKSLAAGQVIRLPGVISYKNYIEWWVKQDKEAGLDYWERYLAGYRHRAALPGLPSAKTEIGGAYKTGEYTFEIDKKSTAAVKDFAGRDGVTLNTVIQGVWGLLLQRYNDINDVVFGAVVSGRPPELHGVEQMIGLFINTVPVRVTSHPGQDFSQLIKTLQQSSAAGKAYEYLPLADIQAKSPMKSNLIDHILVFENYPIHQQVKNTKEQGTALDLRLEDIKVLEQTNYHFNIIIIPGESILLKLSYNVLIYDRTLIKRVGGHIKKILRQVTDNPTLALKEIEILTAEEKQQIVFDFNRTDVSYPEDKLVHGLFAEQVERAPDRTALVGPKLQNTNYKQIDVLRADVNSFAEVHLSYNELNDRSNQLAHVLIEKGVRPDTIVGILVERSLEMIVGILAILKAGGAYLPIDPDYPQERIDYMLSDSNAKVLLSEGSALSEVSNGIQVIKPGELAEKLPTHLIHPTHPTHPTQLCYVIYTSGSTGQPKGVMVNHTSIVNTLSGLYRSYPFTRRDVYLMKTSCVFDVSVTELFGWFMGITVDGEKGGRLALLAPGGEKEPQRILETVQRLQVTHINFVPSMFNVFLEYLTPLNIVKLGALKYIFLAGEALQAETVKTFQGLNRTIHHLRLENLYGPTEASVYASGYSLSDWSGGNSIPIGKPLQNVRLYILDRHDRLQPVNVPGELCIAGTGTARGYLNRPGLTAEKFDHDLKDYPDYHDKYYRSYTSYRTYISKKIYKTGDLACWLPDGNIEFLGRIDRQVKIRGFRIELEEIEKQLVKHPRVKETAVICRTDEKKDNYICAYFTGSGEGKTGKKNLPEPAEFKEYLAQTLPGYMIPSYFVPLETLPCTSSGKIDRKALPVPGIEKEQSGVYIAPRSQIEEKLAVIWSGVLGIEKHLIGIDSDFLQLGGHSLKATSLVLKVQQALQVNVSLAEVFKRPTIRGMSAFIHAAEKTKYAPIESAEKKEYYPLSSAQARFYILQRVTPQSTAYNITAVYQVEGPVEKERFENALKRLIRQYEILRTSFEMIAGEPVQRIRQHLEFEIEYYDSEVAGEGDRCRWEELADRNPQPATALISSFIRPFDLSRPPLLRLGLIKLAEEKHILVFDMHHIISDGTSMSIFLTGFMALYADRDINPLQLQYKDFARWQYNRLTSGQLKKQETYWDERFHGELPVLDIATDFPRPLVQHFEGDWFTLVLEKSVTRGLNHLLKETGTTLFMALLVVYNILLARYTGQEDIIIGTTIASRHHPDLEHVPGLLIETLALRNYPFGQQTFGEFLKVVKQSTLDAYDNQDYPFKELIKKLGAENEISRNPVFDAMLIVQNIEKTEFQLEGLKFSPYHSSDEEARHMSKVDFTIEAMEAGDQVYFRLEYCTRLYKRETMEQFGRHFINIISEVVKDPGIRLLDIRVMDEEEKNQLLESFNNTSREYPRMQTVYELFTDQAAGTPDHVALVGKGEGWKGRRVEGKKEEAPFGQVLNALGESSLRAKRQDLIAITYKELNEISDRLAKLLREKGVQPDTIVGIKVEPSLEMVMGLFGILKAGGAYMPVDPDYPQDRIDFMLEDSSAKILLTGQEIADFSSPQAFKTRPKGSPSFVICNLEFGISPQQGGNLAYIIYTSGTTGRPKGVLVEHRNLAAYIHAFEQEFDLRPEDTVIQQVSYAFDAFVEELYPILLRGGKLVIAGREVTRDITGLCDFIEKHRVTFITCSPQLLNELNQAAAGFSGKGNNPLVSLRIMISGGDQLKAEYIENLMEIGQVYNTYGPTESTVCATYYRCRQDGKLPSNVCIGKPIANYQVYILDKYGNLLPIGVAGELCVTGSGVTRGYLNRPELTAEKFHAVYKTGDLARWLSDGNIEFLGRIDRQVKVRGYRIELGEIENQLANIENIKKTVVVEERRKSGQNYLAAYVVMNPGAVLDISRVKARLALKLPGYMIPPYIMEVEEIPLTITGKIHRKQLPPPETSPGQSYAVPASNKEKIVADIWKQVLEKDRVGLEDNFFDLGGTSLDIFTINTRLNETFNRQIPVVALFQHSTIRSLAGYLEQENDEKGIAREKQKEMSEALDRGKKVIKKIINKDEASLQNKETGLELAVIGMAGIFPGARHIDEFWENLKNGIESICFFTDEELQAEGIDADTLNNPNYIKAKGVIDGVEYFDASFFGYTAREAQIMDPQMRIFQQCIWHALEDAGYNPISYNGRIGLYAGASPNLNWEALTCFGGANQGLSAFMVAQLADKDFMCTHISYKLNLKGPSVSLQTACSTSLVAVHWAVQGLLHGDCEIALAGGVSINYPPKRGYLYQPGMILSADGHNRSFDEEASGSVFGDGVGVVVLKRLADAAAARDNIYAVIKGSAINNDGFRKVGYTAPSVDGQAEVIKAAQLMAGVVPESITYIEAHGTATALGDTVEIEALKQVFNTNKKASCALGTIKSNLGHLYSAAGLAGFIKTVLALKHRLIPPGLHFNTPNPAIDFKNTPFYVVTRLKEWENNGYPLRAGVSSFGIGGTNAHVVLEEAPKIDHGRGITGGSEHQLILLSAKTPTALEKQTENLVRFIKKNPGINLADMAYTLQVGRRHFPYRRMLLCSTIDTDYDRLALYMKRIPTAYVKEENPPVVFMFCGQGSQYVNMGIDLYRSEPIFREEMDRCFEILKPMLDYDIKEILYPGRGEVSEEGSPVSQIHQTRFTQPIVFSFEYALAKLLIRWGITPRAMMGYSFGEYIAACIAGVLSLPDALKLVIIRGQLIQQTPEGAMTSVPLPENQLKTLLNKDLYLAIVNGPTCIVSGAKAAVAAFEKEMKKKRVICVPLNMSRAIHSPLMAPIREEFENQVSRFRFKPPQIPYISNVTSQWITGQQATNPGYWGEHLCSTVRFSHGLKELLKEENAIFIEIGAGRILGMMVRTHPDKKPGHIILNTVKHQQEKTTDHCFLLDKVGQMWNHGQPVDWQGFHGEEPRYRVSLPAYPFEGKRYWPEANINDLMSGSSGIAPVFPGASAQGANAELESLDHIEARETADENYQPPRSELEKSIAHWWQKLLGVSRAGIHDNFFFMNGNSLMGTQMISHLMEEYQVEIPIDRFYEIPTIAHLAEVIEELLKK